MLVLTRKKRQAVVIITASGERIIVRINKLNGAQVSLAFEADRSITIIRSELEKPKDTEVGLA